MRTGIILTLLFWASSVSAGPISGCVSELPATFQFASSLHVRISGWESDFDYEHGCNPSREGAVPTAGAYSVSFDSGITTVSFIASGFNPCKSTQLDMREVLSDGSYLFHDFTVNLPRPAYCYIPPGVVTPLVETGGGGGGEGSDSPPTVTPPSTIAPPVITPPMAPVPEPASVLLFASGLLLAWRKQKHLRN